MHAALVKAKSKQSPLMCPTANDLITGSGLREGSGADEIGDRTGEGRDDADRGSRLDAARERG